MNTLHIVKVEETYRVYYNKRENEYRSLNDAFYDYSFIKELKDYVLEIFRHNEIKRLTVAGCGDFWWAEIENKEGDLLEEEGSSPLKAIAELLLSIEARDKE
jgi:hypothetical protein